MASKGFFNAFDDIWMLDGMRTPMVDYCGALGHISPTDLGIKAARAALEKAGVPPPKRPMRLTKRASSVRATR